MSQSDLERALNYPFDLGVLFQKKKAIRRLLGEKPIPFQERRIAILGGSTTSEIRDMMELFLLKEGIRPAFYESEYNRYYEDVLFDNPALTAFQPQILYIHTTWRNLRHRPVMTDSPDDVEAKLQAEFSLIESLWNKVQGTLGALVIQNNVELPPVRLLGNLDGSDPRGEVHFVGALNARIAEAVRTRPHVLIQDIHYLSAVFGLDRWHDVENWCAYKYAPAYDAIPLVAHNVARIIGASCGKSRKGIVVDLDNTLWGGVVGDDGIDRLQVGKETPAAEAYSGFQAYLKDLRQRGILLAVASKNDPKAAMDGLRHPENTLKPEDFASIQATWGPKDQSIVKIAADLDLGVESFVFVDDNPAERDWVRSQLPGVEVPEVGSEVSRFAQMLDREGYFEPVSLSAEDITRNRFYGENRERAEAAGTFSTYDDFLRSLEMRADIAPFCPLYLDRITQLINKTNQFNLTSRRMTPAEVEAASRDPRAITRYGKLKDRFGDNGLVSVLMAHQEGNAAHIDLWLMSCRVLKRRFENAFFHALVEECRLRGIQKIVGTYWPTPKNGMVRDFYRDLGFKLTAQAEDGQTQWELAISAATTAAEDWPGVMEPRTAQAGPEEGKSHVG